MADASGAVGVEIVEQFTTADQQRRAAKLGMWAWLLTELLLFSGLLVSALVLRLLYPASVSAAASHLKLWIGAVNTVILIISSFMMSGAIETSRLARQRPMVRFLLATAAFGVLFLIMKSYEYYTDYADHLTPFLARPYALAADRASELFINLYWVTTILHFIHLSVGVAIVLVMAWLAARPGFLSRHQNRIEIVGLYWHFIDLVWIIVFPTLYMANR